MKHYLFVLAFMAVLNIHAQSLSPTEKESVLVVRLNNKDGGFFANIKVTITDQNNTKIAEGKSNTSGIFEALLPINSMYHVVVENYPEVQIVKIPDAGFAKKTVTIIYEADAVEKQKEWALTPQQEKQIDEWTAKLPAEITLSEANMAALSPTDFQILYTLAISDLNKKPLCCEKVVLQGIRRNKKFIATTTSTGTVKLLLPKGDRYNVNFTYDSCFSSFEVPFSSGVATRTFTLEYIGTKEIVRMRKEEADRVKAEELRLKKEKDEFEAKCKKMGISVEEGRKRELMASMDFVDTVVLTVFHRNKQWKQKLIVCDLTGSMSPYSSQLLLWYNLNYKLEQNLQFVFFNDGDNKPDEEKKIGSTGGIYYSPSNGYDSLVRLMSRVAAAGGGGDCPENNMEALIKGTKMARPFKEIVMIADNNAPVKDISLLSQFKMPVHVIVCGGYGGVHPDYLQIAYKTGGTVHTMEEDITSIAKMLDGQTVTIGNMKYKLLNGKFYKLDEM